MVNIKDMDSTQVEGDRLEAIFNRQRELMEKYHDIEKENGLLQTEEIPVDLHSRNGQARLKDFAWRITEELGEALEAFRIHDDPMHFKEEIADALHFLTEFSILAGVEPGDIVEEPEDERLDKLSFLFKEVVDNVNWRQFTLNKDIRNIHSLTYGTGKIIEKLGVTCNFLKNKPWKQTHMVTDVSRFEQALVETWKRFIELLIVSDIFSKDITKLYFGKSDVNEWRINSNY